MLQIHISFLIKTTSEYPTIPKVANPEWSWCTVQMDVIIDVITIHLTRIDQYLFKGVMFRQQSLLTTGKLAKL